MNEDYSRHRHPDRATSVEGAQAIRVRAPSQKLRLLAAFGRFDEGLTDEEAAGNVGLLDSCYWKRCGELRMEGYIADHPKRLTRKGRSGVSRIVSVITPSGRVELRAWGLS